MKTKQIIVLVIVVIVIVAAVFMWKSAAKPATPSLDNSKELQEQAQNLNPIKETVVNPYEKASTNPYEKVKTNPFE